MGPDFDYVMDALEEIVQKSEKKVENQESLYDENQDKNLIYYLCMHTRSASLVCELVAKMYRWILTVDRRDRIVDLMRRAAELMPTDPPNSEVEEYCKKIKRRFDDVKRFINEAANKELNQEEILTKVS